MRFAVEEINNSTGPQSLLPGIKLGYQLYDICSVPAGILATVDFLQQHHHSISTSKTDPNYNNSQKAVAVIGPDSSSKSLTPAALLGSYLIPQVSFTQCSSIFTHLICHRIILHILFALL